ncbi:MAG: hypothetical protein JWO47_989 [Candidatus Saccharibacteria bacterium]|nr:hypothetical protein [Candidatus Saccharibacteria bacterium]
MKLRNSIKTRTRSLRKGSSILWTIAALSFVMLISYQKVFATPLTLDSNGKIIAGSCDLLIVNPAVSGLSDAAIDLATILNNGGSRNGGATRVATSNTLYGSIYIAHADASSADYLKVSDIKKVLIAQGITNLVQINVGGGGCGSRSGQAFPPGDYIRNGQGTSDWRFISDDRGSRADHGSVTVNAAGAIADMVIAKPGHNSGTTATGDGNITPKPQTISGGDKVKALRDILKLTVISSGGSPGAPSPTPPAADNVTSLSAFTFKFYSRSQIDLKITGTLTVNGSTVPFDITRHLFDNYTDDTDNQFTDTTGSCSSSLSIEGAINSSTESSIYKIIENRDRKFEIKIPTSALSLPSASSTCITLISGLTDDTKSSGALSSLAALPAIPGIPLWGLNYEDVLNEEYINSAGNDTSYHRAAFSFYYTADGGINEVKGSHFGIGKLAKITGTTLQKTGGDVLEGSAAVVFGNKSDACNNDVVYAYESSAIPNILYKYNASPKGSCTYVEEVRDNGTSTIILAFDDDTATNPGGNVDPNNPANQLPGNGDIGGGASSCESLNGFIGWIACPVIDSISKGLKAVDDLIQNQLASDIVSGNASNCKDNTTGCTSGTSESTRQLKVTWVRMRDLAYLILIPIMLVMVIGTAINVGPFDAYTVKKALPRMVVGVIFIALSWYLCLFVINLTNVVGGGVKGIIEQPFVSSTGRCPTEITLSCVFDGGVESFVNNVILLLPAIAALILIVWFFLGTILLFLAVTYGVIVLRQIFLVALLLVSPLAILPWIFPMNNKLWKAWWDSFSRLLLVYPLMMILISVGHVFAYIIDTTNAGGIASFLFKIAAYILPLVFIPAAFKFAGGAFATISGMANDKSKGLFDRQKKGRQAKFHRLQNDQFFKRPGSSAFKNRVNSALGKASNINKLGADPRKWKNELGVNHMGHALSQSQRMLQDKSEIGQRVLGDDNFMYAASIATNREEFLKMLGDTGRNGESLKNNGIDYDNLVKEYGMAGMKLAAFDKAAAGGTMYGYKYIDKDGKEQTRLSSMAAARHLTAEVGHGDAGLRAYLNGRIRSVSTNAGRPDEGLLSHGSAEAIAESERTGTLMGYDETTGEMFASDIAGNRLAADAPRLDVREDPSILAEAVARRSFAQSHGSQWMGPNVKDPATQKFVNFVNKDVEDAVTTGDSRSLADSLVKYYEGVEGATTSQKREMLAKGFGREVQDLTKLSPAQLEMLGPSIWTEETEVIPGPTPDGSPHTRPTGRRVLKDSTITKARMAELARNSKEVREVSRQYGTDYEQGGRPAAPGDLPPVTPAL